MAPQPNKLTIEDMRRTAAERGGKCLSDTYVNANSKLTWQCSEGHTWEAKPGAIRHGSWCPFCAGVKKGNIDEMRAIAAEHGGKCLSKKYVNNTTKLEWQCSEGHRWQAIPKTIRKGVWCPTCAGVTPLTIENMKSLAESRGGKCLSTKYVNSKTKLEWQCSEGHRWKATPSDVRQGKWCAKCAGKAPHTIAEMRELASSKGGKCLSKQYRNSKTKLKWQCSEGHVWESAPGNIISGRWCPVCAGHLPQTLDDMHAMARSRGGKCLSTEYVNSQTRLEWQCDKGHTWLATPASVKHGTWCPTCAGKTKLTIEEMREIAASRGGHCLSDEYRNNRTRLEWQCKEGHVWSAAPDGIKSGQWCPVCAVEMRARSQAMTIEEMRELAKVRGGKCLSREYVNNRTALLWECSFGHRWEAWPSAIIAGTWCPTCKSGASERVCRAAFEAIFERPFPKQKPEWLNGLELDGYCDELAIAFEYQGQYHYHEDDFFNREEGRFAVVQERDEFKRKECRKQGVQLFQVPYTVKHRQFLRHIIEESDKRGIEIPAWARKLRYKDLRVASSDRLGELREIASERGGECLSTAYVNAHTKMKWRCAEGHEWEAKPSSIKNNGTWCPVCAAAKSGEWRKLDIEEMRQIAAERGGKCLSTEYVNVNTKLLWECAKGHRWKATPNTVRAGNWCRKCSGLEPLTLEEMQEIAAEHGGKCLSTEYVNTSTKLLWQCEKGHQWEATPDNVKQGHWCPRCAGVARLTIEDMHELAASFGGKCLSTEYVNNRQKLTWQCAKGHVWESTPKNVKKGRWCRECRI